MYSYYGIKDFIKCVSDSFEKLGYIIDDFPLFKNMFDIHDKKDNCKEYFNTYVQESCPDIIIWFFFYVPVDIISLIRINNPNVYNILYNFDDPFSWSDNKSIKLSEKCKYFDLAIGTCEETINLYKSNGAKDSIFCPPGYDQTVNYPIDNTDYDCDVSICITNLYENLNTYDDQYFNRKELIDLIVSQGDINVKIYGPDFLKLKYPDNYVGFLQYNELNGVYNKSKINICTHVCKSKSKYINERSILIIGSGGLLLVDPIKDLDKLISQDECVYIQKDNFILQIKEILKNYDNYIPVKQKGKIRSLQYTWDKFAEKIHKKIGLYFFEEKFYRELYNIPENIVNLKDYWEKEGINYNQIPFKYTVPKYFDSPQYSIDNKLIDKNVSKEYVYWHYRLNSRSSQYIIQFDSKKNFDLKKIIDECKIDSDAWFKINCSFKSIISGEKIEENLKFLENINKQYPYFNINQLLSLYFNIVEK